MQQVGEGTRYTGKLSGVEFKSTPDSMAKLYDEGYVLFSLGPLYIYAGINESIPIRFAGDECTQRALKDKPVRHTNISFDHGILARCEMWNNTLDIMDAESYLCFKSWMLAQVFMNRVKKDVLVPRCCSAPVLDPLAFEINKQIPTSMDVFCTSGMYSRIVPKGSVTDYKQTKSFIDLERLQPEPIVIQMGKAMLTVS